MTNLLNKSLFKASNKLSFKGKNKPFAEQLRSVFCIQYMPFEHFSGISISE